MKRLTCLFLLAAVAGCAHDPVVRNASDNKPGSVTPLNAHLARAGHRAILIFVHGVGDHCPGYALDDTNGWLNRSAQTRLHLTPDGNPAGDTVTLPDPLNTTSKGVDPLSNYTIRHRAFLYDGQLHVDAVEITWSGLTRWIKTKQLGFDISEAIEPTKGALANESSTPREDKSCVGVIPKKFDQNRQALNRLLKEQTLDRSLSDAVLYVGSYGAKINIAMADGICRAVTGNYQADHPCDWSRAADVAKGNDYSVLFFTHSLGSRIVFDTLLELAGFPVRPGSTLGDERSPDRRELARGIRDNTSAIYMMANQLPLLGLAFAPPSDRSDSGDTPYFEVSQAGPGLAVMLRSQSAPIMVGTGTASSMKCRSNGDSLGCFLGMGSPGPAVTSLEVVAFSDPNDLLTYSLPSSYDKAYGSKRIRFTNVFVDNSTHWFGQVENPAKAHNDYFLKDANWNVIVCGANENGVLNSPCR